MIKVTVWNEHVQETMTEEKLAGTVLIKKESVLFAVGIIIYNFENMLI